jgi:hypothetical protein
MNAVSCHIKEEDSDDRCLFRWERTASAASLIGSDLPQMGQAALEVRRGGAEVLKSTRARDGSGEGVGGSRPRDWRNCYAPTPERKLRSLMKLRTSAIRSCSICHDVDRFVLHFTATVLIILQITK